nr:DUF6283 family protein [Kibdelosporangium phytohabitans]
MAARHVQTVASGPSCGVPGALRGRWEAVSSASYRARPCAQCPWRTDADLSLFSDDDMVKLERADGSPGGEAAPSAPAMSCHLDQPGTAHAMRLCAGWLAVVGPHHLGIRMAVIAGRLPEQALSVGQDWAELFANLDQLVAERGEQIAVNGAAKNTLHR